MRIIRDYEVSIWTLQDSFITVLKPFGIELKGQIQEPDFKLVDDGTQEFTFKLPMYYLYNGERIENPLWCNTINGVIVASMRKVKLIFKKHTPQQKVYEFLITKVIESHDKDEFMCEITCEGLAFHELGKIGYRIALETEDITYDQDAWYDGKEMTDEETNEKYILGSDQRRYGLEMPRPTLQYWNDKIFKRKDGNWKWEWTYDILMDYSNNPGLGREKNKVYEDEYVSSWAYNPDHDQVEAQAYESNREKWRTVDLTDSNVYNLTQDLAKEFGVFCRYEYEHDDNFHIIGRKVIYYNNFIMEKTGALDITYPYGASKIARTSDSTDMITKMYVEVESNDDGEDVTIMNSSANKTREDYILNFDYLNTIGAITPQQYSEIKKFETAVYNLNMKIAPLQARQLALSAELPNLKAQETTFKNSIAGDQEARSQANDFLNALTDGTGTIEVTASNPKMGMIMGDNPEYIKITELGVDYSTLRIFKTYNTSSHVLTDEYRGDPIYDEFENLIQIQNPEHFQSYYYLPSNGIYSLSGEYGHLRYYEENNYQFLFDSSAFKDLFRKLNSCLLSSLELSFNIDFERVPQNSFYVDLYIAHKTSFDNGSPEYQYLKSFEFATSNSQDRYAPKIKIDPTETIDSDFRFNSTDTQQGIYLSAIVSFDDPNGKIISNVAQDQGNSTTGIKATLSLGGKKETVEGSMARTQSRVYLTYTYSPKTYYERVAEIWLNRENADTRNLDSVQKKIENTNIQLDKCQEELNKYLDEKELLLTRLEKLMGPALREGYWQPEDYQDYGDQYLENFSTKNAPIAATYYTDDEEVKAKINYIDDTEDDTKVQLKYILDSEPFTGEQVNYVNSFTKDNGEEYLYYPCIKLTNGSILNFVKKYYDQLSVSFCDVTQLDIKYRTNPAYRKVYHINSRCEYAFMNIDGAPTPVIMVTGARDDNLTDRQFAALTGQTYVKDNIIYDEFDNIDVRLTVIDPLKTDIQQSYKLSKKDWYIPNDIKQMLYPRLQISSLNVRIDDDEFDIKYGGHLLSNYSDYSLLIRDNSYYATFKPIVFAQYGIGLEGEARFVISNANTTVYLDALQVSKENSRPKVEYEITINTVNKQLIDEAYNYLGYIANINDFDLKFENVRGYISELDLKLDKPWEDSATIKNYKTKFEDLFATIVAQTEQMQKNAVTIAVASTAFTANGKLVPDVVEESIRHVDLSEAFSKGTLTWDEAEGMWAESDSGVVAIRGGGIFTATQKDAGGNWKWNTGITPEGINADIITAGQLDTNRIKVYAGDQLRFQLNADGLFAYKTMFDNPKPEYTLATNYAAISREIQDNHGIDYRQYVVHNGEGIFLVAKQGAPLILEDRHSEGYYIKRLQQDVERVSITWDGLTLRNYKNEKVFYADADTGDLTLAGTIYAKAGVFEGEVRAKSLFIGEDTTQNYIGEDGHLLPSVFSDDIAGGIVKAASLTVDNDTGKIRLSSLQFDALKGSSSGINIDPERLYFYSETSSVIEGEQNAQAIKNASSVYIDSEGITIGTNGSINVNANQLHIFSSGDASHEINIEDSSLSPADVWNKVTTYTATNATNLTLTNDSIELSALREGPDILDTKGDFIVNTNGLILNYDIEKTQDEKNAEWQKFRNNKIDAAREKAIQDAKDAHTFDPDTFEFDESTVEVSEEEFNNQYEAMKNQAKIQLNNQGIDVQGKITIDGSDVWSRGDIIIMNPNATDKDEQWRRTVASVEAEIDRRRSVGAKIRDWVLIMPGYDAVINYTHDNMKWEQPTQNRDRFGSMTLVNTDRHFTDGSSFYEYIVTISINTSARGSVNWGECYVYLSNEDFATASANETLDNLLMDTSKTVRFFLGSLDFANNNGWLKNTSLFTVTVRTEGAGNTVNLCDSGTTLYYYISGVKGKTTWIKEFTVTCKTDATQNRVPCSIYYYPYFDGDNQYITPETEDNNQQESSENNNP